MDKQDAIYELREYLSDMEFYFAENDRYPQDYNPNFIEAVKLAIEVLQEKGVN